VDLAFTSSQVNTRVTLIDGNHFRRSIAVPYYAFRQQEGRRRFGFESD